MDVMFYFLVAYMYTEHFHLALKWANHKEYLFYSISVD